MTSQTGQPLYVAVREAVRDAIDGGIFAPGDRLPSTKALSEQLGVSLVTVHRALQELVAAGILRRGQGRGTFVHERYQAGDDLARGMRFGLVFHRESSLADSYHGLILEGVRQNADELGVDLVLLRFGEDWRNECAGYIYVNPFEELLATPPRFGTRLSSDGGQADPVMVVGARFDHPRFSSVDTDNVDVARQAVKRLRDAGHERIGFVGGESRVSNSVDRREGFTLEMHEAGLEERPEWRLASPGWRLDADGRSRLVELLLAPDRPTALFAAGYYYALDVYAAALEAGLAIPEDLSLLGVDDPPSAAHLSPPLTTLRQPLVELGRMAARGLFDIIAGEASLPCRTTLRAELIERASVSPPGLGVARNGRLATTNHPIEPPAPAAEVIETRGVKAAASPTNGSV
ncbi:MAG: GntR family transcriptional regulator [Planctomycetota bacterium]